MSIVQIILLLLGVAAIVYGVVDLIRSRGGALATGIILIVVGLVLLGVGGFVHLG